MVETNFLIGCAGAAAPEVLRLYNLRAKATVKWNPNYILFSIPFFLIGGFIAWIVDPPTRLAAFYSGLSAPFIITTALKDNAKEEKELLTIQTEIAKLRYQLNDSETEKSKLEKKINELNQKLESKAASSSDTPLYMEEEEFLSEISPELEEFTNININSGIRNININSGNYNEPISGNDYLLDSSPIKSRSTKLNYFLLILIPISLAIFLLFLIKFLISNILILEFTKLLKRESFLIIIAIVCLLLILIWSLRKNKLFKRFIKGL